MMGSSETRLMPNRAAVAAKVIDGEAIILDVTRGAYYSTDGAGAVVWSCIELSLSIPVIARVLSERYEGTAEQLQPHVEALADHLVRENLVVSAGAENIAGEPPAPPPGPREVFTAPQLHKYTDMGDLLALDPPMPVLSDEA